MILVEQSICAFIEGFLMLGAGLGVLGHRLQLKVMLLIATLYALATYGVRQFYMSHKIPFGTHTFVIIGILIMLISFVGKQQLKDSFVAGLLGLVHVVLGESLILFPLMQLFKVDPLTMIGRPGGYILIGIVMYIPLMITFTIGYIFKKTLIDFNSFKNINRM